MVGAIDSRSAHDGDARMRGSSRHGMPTRSRNSSTALPGSPASTQASTPAIIRGSVGGAPPATSYAGS